MGIFQNLDLLSVGVAIAATGILGFAVFLNNPKSVTNRTFLAFSLITIVWGILNYFSYNTDSPELSLWLFRITIFFGVWHAFCLFHFIYVFPSEKKEVGKKYNFGLIPIVGIASLLTLTTFVFNHIEEVGPDGRISKIANGPGIAVFGTVVLMLVISGIVLLIKKTHQAAGIERRQFLSITWGIITTFALLMLFNFIMPAFFDNPGYIPLGAVFIFPFIGFTAYAIFKHHLLNIKVITTEILTFILAVAMLLEVVFSEETSQVVFRSGIFILVLSFGILLIRSVRREVEQREKLEVLTKELSAANDRLKELDQLKSQFLSFASHDLKSPINIIKQFATLIADGTYKKPAKVQETIIKIKNTADRATQLVDDFLDLRKIEEGKFEYNFETKDIVSFVKGITEDYAPVAKAQKNLELSFITTIPKMNVKIDTTRMRQVIQNLLSNSVKYTEQGWIKVMITEEQSSVLITVKDSGIGMNPELLPTLFEQFHRDKNVAKKIQGTGLGLYISKQIVQGHGGEIWVQSEGPGKGSTFFVRLKKA